MFRSALITLMAVYVIMALALSLTFSVVFYHFATHELSEGLHDQYHAFLESDHDADNIEHATRSELLVRSDNLKRDLLYVNAMVFVGSIVLSFVAARRTLKPIEAAHEAQLRFTAEASHELRTPITAMKADTESILSVQHSTRTQLLETLQSNLSDIERLENLTNHLLLMGRFRSRYSPWTERIDVRQAAEQSIHILERRYKDKHIRVIRELNESFVRVEPLVLEQLLTIVIDNAFKYSHEGSELTVQVRSGTTEVIISVIDKGIGIQRQDLPHIFERFYRSSQDDELRGSGFGLGLPLAKDIVSHYKGTIEIASMKGKGTTVSIHMPKSP